MDNIVVHASVSVQEHMLTYLRKLLSRVHAKKLDSYLAVLVGKGMRIGRDTAILEPFFLDPDHCFLISIGTGCFGRIPENAGTN